MGLDIYSYVTYGKIVEHDETNEQYIEDIYPDLDVHAIDDDNEKFLVGVDISSCEAYYSDEPLKLKFLTKSQEIAVQKNFPAGTGMCNYYNWCEVSC